MRPAKTQISLGIRPVWLESSLCAQWVANDPRFLHADNEDSDQTGRMHRLIWVFDGRTCHFVGFVMRRLKYGIDKIDKPFKFDYQSLSNEPRHYKTNKTSVRPAKTQISLAIRPVWSESLLSA